MPVAEPSCCPTCCCAARSSSLIRRYVFRLAARIPTGSGTSVLQGHGSDDHLFCGRSKPDLGRDLLDQVAEAFPTKTIHLVGDAAYGCR